MAGPVNTPKSKFVMIEGVRWGPSEVGEIVIYGGGGKRMDGEWFVDADDDWS